MAREQRVSRSQKVMFNLTEEKKRELEQIAESMGLTTSGLCAYIVGHWLYQFNSVGKPVFQSAVETMTNLMASKLDDMFNNEDFQGLLENITSTMAKEMIKKDE